VRLCSLPHNKLTELDNTEEIKNAVKKVPPPPPPPALRVLLNVHRFDNATNGKAKIFKAVPLLKCQITKAFGRHGDISALLT
jgi:hypothetical protein